MRVLLVFFCLVALSGIGRAEGRWVETHSFKGRGNLQTALFRLGGDACVIRHSHTGDGIFQVALYSAEGKMLGVPVNVAVPDPNVASLSGRGLRYFSVTADGEWSLTLEQSLTAVDELALRQEMRKAAATKVLRKRAEWSGDRGPTVVREITLPAGSWKLVCSGLGVGRAEFQAKSVDQDRLVLATACEGRQKMIGWFYGGGKLSVTVTTPENAWKVEIYREEPLAEPAKN